MAWVNAYASFFAEMGGEWRCAWGEDRTQRRRLQRLIHGYTIAPFFFGSIVMANTAQARKRARQSIKRRADNFAFRSRVRTAIKRVRQAISAGDKAAAEAVFRESTGVIDSIAAKGIIHRNKAARHKSRLSQAIKAL